MLVFGYLSQPQNEFIKYDKGAPERYPSTVYTSAVAMATLRILVI